MSGGSWKIKLKTESGRAKLMLLRYGESGSIKLVGVAEMSWSEYHELIREIAGVAVGGLREVISRALGERLWRDALRTALDRAGISDQPAELAKARLIEFGWDQSTIFAYADEIAVSAAQGVIDKLPKGE